MLTLITGTPGSFKSCYAVWEEAQKVPGSSIEVNGQPVPRRLLSNVRDLLVDHEHINAANLDTWHQWAKPGDVILYDEVQEVWRPRGLGSKVPDCIAALETHRHKGVDLILVTQHPMLIDPNIRRLVNRHLHLRRIAKGCSIIYEWDHCSNPGQVKTSLSHRMWFARKKMFGLYKSAQAHTKPVTKGFPALAFVGLVALGVAGWFGPDVYARVAHRADAGKAAAAAPAATPAAGPASGLAALVSTVPAPAAPLVPPVPVDAPKPRLMGCIAMKGRCECFGVEGDKIPVPMGQCLDGSVNVGQLLPAGIGGGSSSPLGRVLAPVPPATPYAHDFREAAAAPSLPDRF